MSTLQGDGSARATATEYRSVPVPSGAGANLSTGFDEVFAAARLTEMRDLWMKEAVKYNVLPIADRTLERMNAALAGRRDLMGGPSSSDRSVRLGPDVKGGKPTCARATSSHSDFSVVAQAPVAPGKATLRYEFASDGGGLTKGLGWFTGKIARVTIEFEGMTPRDRTAADRVAGEPNRHPAQGVPR